MAILMGINPDAKNLCGATCQVFSRVCGYYRPVYQNWNTGKKEEFKDRVMYNVGAALDKKLDKKQQKHD